MNTTEHEQSRRRGRPTLRPEERRSATLKFRVRDELQDLLQEQSRQSGRSVSEEAELRLINSFKIEPLHRLLFENGSNTVRFVNDILTVIRTVQEYENPKGRHLGSQHWEESELTREALRAAFAVLIPAHLPAPPRPEVISNPPEERRAYGAALEHMREFGKDLAMVLTGQRPDLTEVLVRPNTAEH